MSALIKAEGYMGSNGQWLPEDGSPRKKDAFLQRYSRVRSRLHELLENPELIILIGEYHHDTFAN